MGTFEDVVSGKGEVTEYTTGLMKNLAKRIECNDGITLSVQASEHHYSRPRDNYGPYALVEVGFPSVEPPESWAEYFDGNWKTDDRTDSVYGYIPVELVREYIEAHGGEKEQA